MPRVATIRSARRIGCTALPAYRQKSMSTFHRCLSSRPVDASDVAEEYTNALALPQGRILSRVVQGMNSSQLDQCTAEFARLVLASGSPRRIELLEAAGFVAEVEPADIDDASIPLGQVDARAVAAALAHFKAKRVAQRRYARGADAAWILAADTVCELDGAVLGKPPDRETARAMIRALCARRHGVVTGWCVLGPDGSCRVGRAIATIEIGEVSDDALESFLDEELWRGKAGGYNLPEVVARGWNITCEGDPQTVIGLPITQLTPMLRSLLRGAR